MDFDSAYYKQMLDHLAEGIFYTDRDRRILYWNRAAGNLTGFSAAEVVGSFCDDDPLQHVDENNRPICNIESPVERAMQSAETFTARACLLHKAGYRLPVDIKVSPVYDETGALVGAAEIFSDASERLGLEKLNHGLRRLIRIDPLTRLPNRRAFLDTLQREYLRFARYGTPFSVIFIDIDNFGSINECLDRATGDRTLQWFASKLIGGFRKADMPSRWSGQRFAVLLPNAESKAAERAAEKIRERFDRQLCQETGAFLTASSGVTEITRHDSIERLLKRAEKGLQTAKAEGKNRVVRC